MHARPPTPYLYVRRIHHRARLTARFSRRTVAFRTHYCYHPLGFPSYRGYLVTGSIKAAVEHARTVADGKNVKLAGEVGIVLFRTPLEHADGPADTCALPVALTVNGRNRNLATHGDQRGPLTR